MIAVLDYGIGNLRSAEKALEWLGADAALVSDPQTADRADAVVLPGVGAFGRCMEALEASGLGAAATRAVARGVPFLGICVGMQLLYEGSEEAPGVAGLGVLPGVVARLPEQVKRPQMQWNRLDILAPEVPLLAGLGPDPWMYFVHSYAAPPGDAVVATCEYGGPVPAVVASGSVWATQFHPEKSGPCGLALLANFVRAAGGLPTGPEIDLDALAGGRSGETLPDGRDSGHRLPGQR